ncbi:MAG TPA: VOC family protein [Chloroflexota bacterium]|nr:VOC family protein [Chloroflexota bacterium]
MIAHELGHAGLYVRDLEASTHFYRDVLGFREVCRLPGATFLSSGRAHHELALIEPGPEAVPAPAGPYYGVAHLAVKIGNSLDELRAAHRELLAAGTPITAVLDFEGSQSIVVRDPDGNEVEVFVDATPALWRKDPSHVGTFPKPLTL